MRATTATRATTRRTSQSYPAVSTDMFLGTTPRINQPFSFFQDRFKLGGDYRMPGSSLKTSVGRRPGLSRALAAGGGDHARDDAVGRASTGRPSKTCLLQLKLAHGERNGTTYGTAAWIDPPQNPLMRKFYLADRRRDSANVRFDFTVTEYLAFGLNAESRTTTTTSRRSACSTAAPPTSAAIFAGGRRTDAPLAMPAERISSRPAARSSRSPTGLGTMKDTST